MTKPFFYPQETCEVYLTAATFFTLWHNFSSCRLAAWMQLTAYGRTPAVQDEQMLSTDLASQGFFLKHFHQHLNGMIGKLSANKTIYILFADNLPIMPFKNCETVFALVFAQTWW